MVMCYSEVLHALIPVLMDFSPTSSQITAIHVTVHAKFAQKVQIKTVYFVMILRCSNKVGNVRSDVMKDFMPMLTLYASHVIHGVARAQQSSQLIVDHVLLGISCRLDHLSVKLIVQWATMEIQ